jgi:Domain of Unknown Function (DUF1080)
MCHWPAACADPGWLARGGAGVSTVSSPRFDRTNIMRVRSLLFPFLGLLLASTLHADDWQPDPQFRSLFNGKDLTGWCFRAKEKKKPPRVGEVVEQFDAKTESSDAGRYSARDGILTVNFPKGKKRLLSQLYTVEEFPRDFVLKLEFRASVNADSGIFIRQPQLQCRDYLVAGPYKSLKKYKPQDWNQIEIVVTGRTAHCTCNGEVLEAAFALPKTGPIGLEGDRGQMEYRRIQIKMP